MNEKSKLLTVAEFAAELKVTSSCIRRWILEHKVGTVKLGRVVRIPVSEVDRLISAGLRPARSGR
jgi:excisionase family DNA binding protein